MPTTIFTKQQVDAAPEPVSESNPLHVIDVDPAKSVLSRISTADEAIKVSAGKVYWITIRNTHATVALTIELNDSTDDSGIDRWGTSVEALDINLLPFHAEFNPPIRFDNGIWLDLAGGTGQVVVGYI